MIAALLAATLSFPVCDAQMIADHAPGLTYPEYLEVIDTVENLGGIDRDYATHLRELVLEAYQARDLQAWAKAKCGARGA